MALLLRRLAGPHARVQGVANMGWGMSLGCGGHQAHSYATKAVADLRFATAFSQADTLAEGITDALGTALAQLNGAQPHLCQVSKWGKMFPLERGY